jgi:ABC-type glycerol-3-phosphate transport system substrate-binding protein
MGKKELILIVTVVVIVATIVVVIGFINGKKCKPANLEMWGLYDEPEIFNEFIKDYADQNGCSIKITYKKKSIETYEQELINAFASDQGPDIWMINNNWLAKHKDKIKEFPQDTLKFTFADFQNTFVDVVTNDLTDGGKIYALPLYVDTLALFYNKNYFNSAGIPYPPETWDDLIADLDKLTQKNQWGGIERAGISLGTAENINRASDILSLIMLQNGTKMTSDDKKSATVTDSIVLNKETYYPGKDALRFYTDFSSPTRRNYTWNRQMPYSIDAFADGKSAMMLSYAYQIPALHLKSPYLNYGIAKAPQINGRNFDVNYANYWAYTVSKKSKASDEAWKFVSYLASKTINQRYLQKTDRPTARKDLKEWQTGDNLQLAVFATQSLTARNWYQVDPESIDKIFSDVIESIVLGTATTDKAIETLNDQLNLLMKKQ